MGDDWMQLWVNAAQMKAADQYTIQKLGVPSLELMEHAAQACVQVLEDEKVDLSHVCVVCGSGNNGGDGFAIARILQRKHRNRCTAYRNAAGRLLMECRRKTPIVWS